MRLPEETNFAEEEIRKVLGQRKKQIEFVIDDHLAHLHGQANLTKVMEENLRCRNDLKSYLFEAADIVGTLVLSFC